MGEYITRTLITNSPETGWDRSCDGGERLDADYGRVPVDAYCCCQPLFRDFMKGKEDRRVEEERKTNIHQQNPQDAHIVCKPDLRLRWLRGVLGW